MAKFYIVLRGGFANVYKYLQGGRGVQKVQNLVYVENGCPLSTINLHISLLARKNTSKV